jgi:hypothetical protein
MHLLRCAVSAVVATNSALVNANWDSGAALSNFRAWQLTRLGNRRGTGKETQCPSS